MKADIYNIANSETVLEAALGYLELGFSVVPLTGKQPSVMYTTNRGQDILFKWTSMQVKRPAMSHVHNWYERDWLQNVGIVCGAVSNNLVVIDLDGNDAVKEFAKAFPGVMNYNYYVVSGSGEGVHIYMHVRDLPATTRTKGFELRANGCYVVAPPSVHPVTGSKYEAAKSMTEIQTYDDLDDIVKWIRSKISTKKKATRATTVNLPTISYGNVALSGEIDRLRSASEGARNNQLNLSAFRMGQLVADGVVDRLVVESALLGAALAIGLPENEAVKTINSGISAGMRKPRGVKQ